MSLELLEKPRHHPAWDRFQEMGFPTMKNEVFRYVRLKDLYSTSFDIPDQFEASYSPQDSTLVFINGAYNEAVSRPPKGVIALPLSKAFATYGSFLNARMNKLSKEEKDPFAMLNGAYYAEGLFLYLPPQCVCETPFTILHLITDTDKPLMLSPRIHLFAGKKSAASIALEQSTAHAPVWVNGVMDCALEEAAAVTITKVNNHSPQAHHFWALRATLKNSSVFNSFSVTNGGATSREDYVVRLQGEHAEANLRGVWGLDGHRQHHVNLWLDHQEPACTSLQQFKGTLADAARSSFEGKIYVHQKAQKTQAYQMNNNLLLGDRATANSKPNLEIFADDVKASHGATIGQIDPEQLFYLTARGIPAHVAQKMLVHGFNKEVIDQITHPKLKEEALRIIA